jgi:hypothetical protein
MVDLTERFAWYQARLPSPSMSPNADTVNEAVEDVEPEKPTAWY